MITDEAIEELKVAKREMNAAHRVEFAARLASSAAVARYSKAYEVVTGKPFNPSLLRTAETFFPHFELEAE